MRGIAFLGFALVACQPNSASDIQSLDNFAAGKVKTVNFCQSAPSSELKLIADDLVESMEIDSDADLNLKATVAATLTSVPKGIRDIFVAMGGRIVLTKQAPVLCSQARNEPGQAFGSCFVYAAPSSGEKGQLRIFAYPDAKSLHHSLVRTFGYLFSQFLSKTQFSHHGDASFVKQEAEKLRMAKAELAIAYLADLSVSKSYSLKSMEPYLGVGSAMALKGKFGPNRSLSGASVYQGVSFRAPNERRVSAATQRERLEAFEDYVFAEAFDSYHCNSWGTAATNTLKGLQRDFPTVYRLFPDIYRVALVAVQENGNGMAALFQPYLDAATGNTSPTQGIGFGLQDGGDVDTDLGAAPSGYFDAGSMNVVDSQPVAVHTPMTFEGPAAMTTSSTADYQQLVTTSPVAVSGGFVPSVTPPTLGQKIGDGVDNIAASGNGGLIGMGAGYIAETATGFVTDAPNVAEGVGQIVSDGTTFYVENREAINMAGGTAITYGSGMAAAAGVTTATVATAAAGVAVVGFSGYQVYRLGDALVDLNQAENQLAGSEARLDGMAAKNGFQNSTDFDADLKDQNAILAQKITREDLTGWVNNSTWEAEQLAQNGKVDVALARIKATKTLMKTKSEWIQSIHSPSDIMFSEHMISSAERRIRNLAAPAPVPAGRFGKGGRHGDVME